MVVRVTKDPDGTASLSYRRPDGSGHQVPIGPAHGYGPIQDLAHIIVERRLGLGSGFLAGVARGDISDFGAETASRLGGDAVLTRSIAGLLSFEAVTGHRLTVGDFNDAVAERSSRLRPGYRALELKPSMLYELRNDLVALWRQWTVLPGGSWIELDQGTGGQGSGVGGP